MLKGVLIAGGGSSLGITLWVVAVKIIALVAGPAGVGLFSLLRQLQQVAATVAVLNGQPAIIQGIASRAPREQGIYWREVRRVIGYALAAVSLFLLLFAPQLSSMFSGALSVTMIRGLVPAVVLLVLLNVATALLNARRALGWIASAQGVSGLAGLALAWPAAQALRAGDPGAVLLCITAAALMGLMTAWVGVRAKDALPTPPVLAEEAEAARARSEYLRLTAALIISGGLVAAMPLAVRALLAAAQGIEAVGYFDASWTIGVTFTMLLITAVHAYYLPTLSAAKDRAERQALVERFFRFAGVAVVPALLVAQLGKAILVRLLYSQEFDATLPLLRWLLLGDYALVGGWMLGLPLLVYGHKRVYVTLQVAWSVAFLAGAVLASPGAAWMDRLGMVFVLAHGALFAATIVTVRVRLGVQLGRTVLTAWIPGALILGAAAWLTWNAAGGWLAGDI